MPTHRVFAHRSSCTLVAKLKGNQSLRAKPLIVCFTNSLYAVLLLTWQYYSTTLHVVMVAPISSLQESRVYWDINYLIKLIFLR